MAVQKLKTPEFRAAFVHVFKARQFGNSEPKYTVTMVFPAGTDLSALKAEAARVAREKWGEKMPAGFHSPFRKGEEKAHLEGFEPGTVFITATTKNPPGIIDRNGPITDETEFYSGCWAKATVNAFTYDRPEKKGVSFGLLNLFKVRDDAPFSGRGAAEEDFADEVAAPAAAAGDPLFD